VAEVEELTGRVGALEERVEKVEASTRGWAAVAVAARDRTGAAAEMLTLLHRDVRGIREVVDQHTTILNQHTAKLDEHTAKLDEHTAKLDEHTAKLDEHTGLLREILARLPPIS
jgi:polyhydroxyalkanoate synthesis regulator phasin